MQFHCARILIMIHHHGTCMEKFWESFWTDKSEILNPRVPSVMYPCMCALHLAWILDIWHSVGLTSSCASCLRTLIVMEKWTSFLSDDRTPDYLISTAAHRFGKRPFSMPWWELPSECQNQHILTIHASLFCYFFSGMFWLEHCEKSFAQRQMRPKKCYFFWAVKPQGHE